MHLYACLLHAISDHFPGSASRGLHPRVTLSHIVLLRSTGKFLYSYVLHSIANQVMEDMSHMPQHPAMMTTTMMETKMGGHALN